MCVCGCVGMQNPTLHFCFTSAGLHLKSGTCVCACVWAHVCVCVRMYACLSVYVSMCMRVSVCAFVCTHVSMYVCVHACVYHRMSGDHTHLLQFVGIDFLAEAKVGAKQVVQPVAVALSEVDHHVLGFVPCHVSCVNVGGAASRVN